MNVSVRVLKNRLSEYLRRVRAGERVIVTDRGQPIAELIPLRSQRLSSKQRLMLLEEAGEVTRPRGRRLADFEPSPIRGRPVAQTLLEDRG
jgi:prevent-host-death family protein